MTHAFTRLLDLVAPPLSIRRQFLALCREAPAVLRSEGILAVLRRAQQAMNRYRTTGALFVSGFDPAPNPPPVPETAPITYAEWIAANEPAEDALAQQKVQAGDLNYRPLISIVVPVFDPPVDVLTAAIESVLAQTYPHWQLCLADGGSTNPQITDILDGHAGHDDRIIVMHLEQNLGISGNSNAALGLATGEFVALMDHDDTLAPSMLYEVAALLNRRPQADVIYFDEDKLSADGAIREHPWFKPDFSPDLMLSTNLLMHAVYRRSLVHEVGGFDPETDGAQDWDLALRCSRHTTAIYHIPKVLYHWRQIAGSASVDAAAKPWAVAAQAVALQRHLEVTDGRRPTVEFPSLGRTRIIWSEPQARVSIIIPTKDKLSLLRACLDSIFTKTAYPDYEIMLVDTGSREDDTLAYYDSLLQQRTDVKLVQMSGEFNYSGANNIGAEAATGDLLLFLNNDTEVLDADWLHEMAGWALRPHIGVVGAKLLRPNGLIQHAGIIMGLAGHGSHIFEDTPEDTYGYFGSTEWYRDYEAVTGACMMMPAELFDRLGGFDEVYRVGYSDIELCLRAAQAGYRTVYTPFARLLHREGGSRGFCLPPGDVLRASCQMLPAIRQGDRYFNPNLSYLHRKPSLARPDEQSPEDSVIDIMRDYSLLPPDLPGIVPPIDDVDLAQPVPWPQARRTQIGKALESLSVLLVSHDLSLSGAPLLLASLAAELAALGVRLTLLSPKDGPVRATYAAAGIPIQIVPWVADSINDAGPLTHAIAGHDLVLANTIVATLGIHTATAFGKPSILWLHESQYGRDLAAEDADVRAALRSASLVLLPTRHLADLYQEFLPDGRFVVMPYGLDESTLPAQPPGIALPAGKVNVVNVGSLEPRKGQDFLMDAILKLPQRTRSSMEFHFLGRTIDPGFVDALREKAAGLLNIHFVGEVDHAQIMAYLDAADVFVLSSRDEVLPVSMLEAMYHGMAIIATRAGGVAEAIEDGETGLLVDFGDGRTLTRSLQALAYDSDLRGRLGRNAAQTFQQRYTMRTFLDQFADLLVRTANSRLPQEGPTGTQPDGLLDEVQMEPRPA